MTEEPAPPPPETPDPLASLPTEQRDLLSRYLDLLLDANTRMNLTRIATREEAETFHLRDALMLLPHLPTSQAGYFTLVDVGSGGGVPGVVLAVVRPHADVTLAESVGKKCDFLRQTVDTLGLSNVTVFQGRAERMPLHGQFDHAVTRAAAPLDKLLAWCHLLVRRGGTLLAMKGPKVDAEIDSARNTLRRQRATLTTHAYPLAGQSGRVVAKVRW